MLKPGENSIAVTAVAVNRQQSTESFIVARGITAPEAAGLSKKAVNKATVASMAGSGGTGRSYALVIGINAYRHIDRLKTAVNDATVVA